MGSPHAKRTWRAAWKAAAENDKAQLICDPTNQLLRLLSKSQGPVSPCTTVEQYKRKTLSKQPKHHGASIQHKQLAAAQGSSLSPLTKKGSNSLNSRIFTVASLGALPCAIARNACRSEEHTSELQSLRHLV